MKKLMFFILIVFLGYSLNNCYAENKIYGPPGTISSIELIQDQLYSIVNNKYLFSSANDGNLWTGVPVPGGPSDIYSIYMSKDTIIVSSAFSCEMSTNHGKNYFQLGLYYNSTSYRIYSFFNVGNDLFATCNTNFLSISRNRGINWSIVPSNLPKNIIINRVCKIDSTLFSATSSGVYYSANAGSDWTQCSASIANIKMQNIFYDNGLIFTSSDSAGIYVSSDKGVTWKQSNKGLTEIAKLKLCISGDKIYAASPNNGLYVSSDKGASWNTVKTGVPNPHLTSICSEGDNIYVSTSSCVFKSNDKGSTWVQINDGIALGNTGPIIADDDNVYASVGNSLYVGKDNGLHWEEINYLEDTVKSAGSKIQTLYKYNSIFIVAKDGRGIYLSSDGGKTMKYDSLGFGASCVFQTFLAFNGVLLAGTSNMGVLISKDNGVSWTPSNSGIGGKDVKAFCLNTNKLYVLVENGVYLSEDQGATWVRKLNWPLRIISIFMKQKTIYAGATNGLFVSYDEGLKWKVLSNASDFRKMASINDYILILNAKLNCTSLTNPKLKSINSGIDSYSDFAINQNYLFLRTPNGVARVKAEFNLTPPTHLYPLNNAVDIYTYLDIGWSNFIDADFYRYQIATDSNFVNIIVENTIEKNVVSLDTFAGKTKYYRRICAINDSTESSWSEIWNFTTIEIPAPYIATPGANTIEQPTKFNFFCFAFYQTDSTYFQIATDSNFKNLIFDVTQRSNTVLINNILNNNTKYFCRARIRHKSLISQWSKTTPFTTFKLVAPILSSPKHLSDSFPTISSFSWKYQFEITKYKLQIALDSNFNDTFFDDEFKTLTTNAIRFKNDTKYYWRVKAINNKEESPWSEVWSFKTVVAETPELIYPADKAVDVPLNVELSWTIQDSVESYQYQVALDSHFTSIVINKTTQKNTAVTAYIYNNIKYYWRVSAKYYYSFSPWSKIRTFTTVGDSEVESEVSSGEEISISPNPASDVMTINYKFEYADAVNLRIYNTLGEQILYMPNLNPVGSSRIDISGFYPGNYRIVFEAGGRKVVKTACVCR